MEEDKVSTPALYVLNNPSPFRSVHSIECHVPYRLFWWVTVCTLHGLWQCSHPYLVQCSLLWWWKLQSVLFFEPGKMPREAIKLLSGIGISVVIPEPFVFASAVIELSGAFFFLSSLHKALSWKKPHTHTAPKTDLIRGPPAGARVHATLESKHSDPQFFASCNDAAESTCPRLWLLCA